MSLRVATRGTPERIVMTCRGSVTDGARAALGIVVKSPERAMALGDGKARTCNGKPGPQATPIFL
jgi:hypothetical protein